MTWSTEYDLPGIHPTIQTKRCIWHKWTEWTYTDLFNNKSKYSTMYPCIGDRREKKCIRCGKQIIQYFV